MVLLRCKDCRKSFEISDDQEDVALNVLIEQGWVQGGHVWNMRGRKYELRHQTHADILEERAEREVCVVCGVVHGPNPFTGCELEEVSFDF